MLHLGFSETQEGIAYCPHCNHDHSVCRRNSESGQAIRCNECDKIFSVFGFDRDQAKVDWEDK